MTNLPETDFLKIKNSLKTFLKSQDELSDYNFEGSVMNTLLDVLSYNTYINSFYTNMAVNESFLDTAIKRSNIVSNAKSLGFTPKMRKPSQITATVSFTPSPVPTSIKVEKGSKLNAELNGITYTFVTLEDNYFQNNGSGVFTKNINFYEGFLYEYEFIVNSENQTFVLPDKNISNKLKVYVKPSPTSSQKDEYTLVENVLNISKNDKVFWIEENYDEKYEISFGDDVLGKSLSIGNVVIVESLVTAGDEANEIVSFTPNFTGINTSNILDTYQPNITIIGQSENGSEKQDIESIKFLAPKHYTMQNILISPDDYKTFILSEYSDAESIAVWGGEDNTPPIYGKTIISIKPKNGFIFSNIRKNELIEKLNRKNIMSIDPLVIDPIFTYINLETSISWNNKETTLNSEQIYNNISSLINNYQDKNLGKFEKSYRKSLLTKDIMNISSIISVEINQTFEKRITPIFESNVTYFLKFNTQIFNPYNGYKGSSVKSSGFNIAGITNTVYITDDGSGKLYLYFINDDNTNIIREVGKVNYITGEMNIGPLDVREINNSNKDIRIIITPISSDYTPIQNEILLFSTNKMILKNSDKNEIDKSSIIYYSGNVSPINETPILSRVI